MTLKEAILKSLDEIGELTTYSEVLNHILQHQYFDFGTSKTPGSTVSASLGSFIRHGDARVKRIKREGGSYAYYLAKNEQLIGIDILPELTEKESSKKSGKTLGYEERDLHKLLSSYLKINNVYAKTIFHEQSSGRDSNQIWTHPDMVGVKFLELHSPASQNLLRAVNRIDTIKLYSYEIKKEINSDSELKKAFFQAVSNSSWANYGYLVAFEISDNLKDELERLNQSFGIGVIELNSNPYESRVLHQPKIHDLDFKTIDKLCKMNKEFEMFIEHIEKLMTAETRFIKSTKKEFEGFCNDYFQNDSDIETYCKEKHIPFDPE